MNRAIGNQGKRRVKLGYDTARAGICRDVEITVRHLEVYPTMLTRRAFIPAAAIGILSLGRLAEAAAQEATPGASPAASPVTHGVAQLPVKVPGQLTVHTDQPVYAPWFVDDDPSNGKGFESALTYALAERLGIAADQIVWGVTPFVESFATGEKDFDFYITEVLITDQRKQAVDFSDPYYVSPLSLVAQKDSPVFAAETLADLKGFTFGAQAGTNNATYIDEIIRPDQPLVEFDTNLATMQALSDGTIDAILEPLQTGLEMETFQFDNLALVALLPESGHDMGMVFEKGSALVPFVNQALRSLKDDGTLDGFITEWLPVPEDLREIAS
jgi:polar amino acid transport system substrate-binding protein